jgi:hypothetical protein
MIGSPEIYQAQLKAAIDALITRYSRPLVEAIVTSPRDTKLRDDVKTQLHNDLLALSSYAEEGYQIQPAAMDADMLPLAANTSGSDLMGFIDRPGFAKCLAQSGKETHDPNAWFAEMEKEVKDDLAFMESYLRREVFLASGITDFREQEFRRIRSTFSAYEAYWEGIIDNAYERQDPELMKSLPKHLKADEQFSKISATISNLKQALTDSVMTQ